MKHLFLLICLFMLLAGTSLADERSGPGRRTILREGWGTVFFQPEKLHGDYEFAINEDGDTYTLTSDDGKTVIHESEDDVKLVFPDFEGDVHFENDTLKVQWGKDAHTFHRDGNTMIYDGPIGEVKFVRGERQLEIDGPRGKVLIQDGDGEYTVESPLGKTRYVTTLTGFKVSGLRLTEHPYIRRGAVFSHNGIGVYIELALLDPKNPLFRLLEWDTIVEIETSGP